MILQNSRPDTAPGSDDTLSTTPALNIGTAPQAEATRHEAANSFDPMDGQPRQPAATEAANSLDSVDGQSRQPAVIELPHHDDSMNLRHSDTDQSHRSDHSEIHQSLCPDIQKIALDIESIKNLMKTKDMEIDLLNDEVKDSICNH